MKCFSCDSLIFFKVAQLLDYSDFKESRFSNKKSSRKQTDQNAVGYSRVGGPLLLQNINHCNIVTVIVMYCTIVVGGGASLYFFSKKCTDIQKGVQIHPSSNCPQLDRLDDQCYSIVQPTNFTTHNM